MMGFQRRYSSQIVGIALGSLAVGFMAGAGVSTLLYIGKSSALGTQLSNATSRVHVLEGLLQIASDAPAAAAFSPNLPPARHAAVDDSFSMPAHTPAVAPLPDPPQVAPPVEDKAAIAAAALAKAQAAQRAQMAAQAAAARKAEAEAAARKKAEEETAAAAARKAAVAAATAPQAATTPVLATVSPAEVAGATARNPVVGVNAEKLGVAKLLPTGVQLRSGNVIKIGDRFGSGERLLSVNPGNNLIITSDRQVLVFFTPTN